MWTKPPLAGSRKAGGEMVVTLFNVNLRIPLSQISGGTPRAFRGWYTYNVKSRSRSRTRGLDIPVRMALELGVPSAVSSADNGCLLDSISCRSIVGRETCRKTTSGKQSGKWNLSTICDHRAGSPSATFLHHRQTSITSIQPYGEPHSKLPATSARSTMQWVKIMESISVGRVKIACLVLCF